MHRLLIVVVGALLIAAPVASQDNAEDSGVGEDDDAVAAGTEPSTEPESPEEPDEPEFDEAGLDVQGFEDQDDDFKPSEEIPTDQSIEFPTDI